jgi:hypothetical protein
MGAWCTGTLQGLHEHGTVVTSFSMLNSEAGTKGTILGFQAKVNRNSFFKLVHS